MICPPRNTSQTVNAQTFASWLQHIKNSASLANAPWLDLGCGSGALALGLTSILPPSAKVHAVDASKEAAAWAEYNVQRLGRAETVQVG